MRSKASFKGHPIHPALIPFPFAFLFGAFLFDAGGMLFAKESWWITGMHLAVVGSIAAIIAALPGIIDYIYTVPPNSSAKTRAGRHGLINVGALVLFIVALVLRQNTGGAPTALIIAIEAVGAGLLAIGGWLGGVLVSSNQISVNPRYAEAGSWNEQTISAEPGKTAVVAKAAELEVDQMKLLHVNGQRIVLARSEKGYVAFEDHCTHKGGSLAGGAMICGTVQCPWHGSQFDTATGAVKAGPATKAIETYQVEVSGKEVRLHVPKKKPG